MKNKKTINKPLKWIILISTILALLASIYSIYNILLLGSIETVIRYIIVFILIIIDILFLVKFFKIVKNKGKKKRPMMVICLLTLYTIGNAFIGLAINRVYSSINKMNKNYVTYSTSLITLTDSNIDKISDFKDKKIGIISDKKSPDGYIISREIINENKLTEKNDLVEYDNFSSMLVDLYDNEIDGVFISSNYSIMFKNIEQFENIDKDTKVITKKEKKMKKSDTSTTIASTGNKQIKEPFTILLMGVDSEVDGLENAAGFNGDALMVVTFNPKTLTATMLSIPRDTYVPIACFRNNIENKITHAAWYGESCMIKTIENFTGIKIDYYAKINFKGVVGLVDKIGGIYVDVPQDLCTDSSDRGGQICINKGYQLLNGEQALVLSRNRKQLANGDIGRGLNQQIVIGGIVNSIKNNITDIGMLMNVLDTISHNMDTNLTTDQILSFYNIGKDILAKGISKNNTEIISMQSLFLQGTGQTIYDEGTRLPLWNYIPNKDSIKDVVKAMKVNLELEKHDMIKDFDFSINEEYEKTIIGEGPYKTDTTYSLLPDFTGDTKAEAQAWANKNGVKVTFEEVESNEKAGTVIDQSEPYRKRIDKLDGPVILKIAKKKIVNNDDDDKIDCSEDEDNDKCKVPDFESYSEALKWAKKLKDVKITCEPSSCEGKLIKQSIAPGKYIGSRKELTLTFEKENGKEPSE